MRTTHWALGCEWGGSYLNALLAVGLLVQQQLALQQEAFAAAAARLRAVVRDAHVLLQVPAVVEDARAPPARVLLLVLQPDFGATALLLR